MKTEERISSILNTVQLSAEITGFQSFRISELQLDNYPNFELPTNRRLGHLVENVISECIKISNNYIILHENVQIIEDKNTIGELDFIIKHTDTQEVIHLELAYKFYLYDPSISAESINNWIGPNRRDSLREKLDKLKNKQFPLLHHEATQATLATLTTDSVSQKLCMLTSLFIPYNFKAKFHPSLQKAIKGYYIDFDMFTNMHAEGKEYAIPTKKAWGMHPSENETWLDFETAKKEIERQLQQKHAPLSWLKSQHTYEQFFVVWW